MQEVRSSPEFDLSRPVASWLEVARSALFSPRKFFLGFEPEGELRGPLVYAVVVGVLAAVLSFVLGPVFRVFFGVETGDEVYGFGALSALAFAVVYPVFVTISAGIFLLVIKVFVGGVGDFTQVFRMCAYAFTAMIFAWLPFFGAFAVAYGLLVTMIIGVRYVYRTTLVTALVIAITGFVPLSLMLIAIRGFAFQFLGG